VYNSIQLDVDAVQPVFQTTNNTEKITALLYDLIYQLDDLIFNGEEYVPYFLNEYLYLIEEHVVPQIISDFGLSSSNKLPEWYQNLRIKPRFIKNESTFVNANNYVSKRFQTLKNKLFAANTTAHTLVENVQHDENVLHDYTHPGAIQVEVGNEFVPQNKLVNYPTGGQKKHKKRSKKQHRRR